MKKFEKYLNSRQANMHFSNANEENSKLSFLDVLINRQSGNFAHHSIINTHLVVFISILKVLSYLH